MAIDISNILMHVDMYVPGENVLTDEQIMCVAESVILKVGDEDENYSEVLCKTLQAIGIINKTKASTSTGTVKREKSHGREIEFFSLSSDEIWDSFADSLVDLCPILPGGGYSIRSPRANGFLGSVSDPVTATSCPTGINYDTKL